MPADRAEGTLLKAAEAAWQAAGSPEASRRAASWLARLGLDAVSQSACLLFPAVFTTESGASPTEPALTKAWGSELTKLLLAVQRLTDFSGRQLGEADQVESLRRMILALSDDLRAVICSLALHQARLELAVRADSGLSAEACLALGQSTFRVQAPLAARLGIWQLKWALEDHAFRLSDPARYKQIAGWLDEKRVEREAFIAEMVVRLQGLLQDQGLAGQVFGRPKHLYSIFNKMRQKGLSFDELLDLRAFRVLCPSEDDCYAVLALLQQHFLPMEGEFDDYIARPKPNGYQSLHLILLDDAERPFEVQIRTEAMHLRAEYGVAAHWKYKEAGGSAKADGGYDEQIQWLRQMLDWGQGLGQVRLSDDTVYVLTPQARIIELPAGATALDFAYRLHTDLGHRCRGAKINGQIAPLKTPLQTGQTVEVLAGRQGGPSRDWLIPEEGYLVSPRARAKVRAYFHALDHAQTPDHASAPGHAPEPSSAAAQAGQDSAELALPIGIRPAAYRPGPSKSGRVLVVGVDKMLTSFARCCRPLPPDPIAGYVTRGRGVSIHRANCSALASLVADHPARQIETSWGPSPDGEGGFATALLLRADRGDGVLRQVTEILAREQAPLTQLQVARGVDHQEIRLETLLRDGPQLSRVLALVSALPGVHRASRV